MSIRNIIDNIRVDLYVFQHAECRILHVLPMAKIKFLLHRVYVVMVQHMKWFNWTVLLYFVHIFSYIAENHYIHTDYCNINSIEDFTNISIKCFNSDWLLVIYTSIHVLIVSIVCNIVTVYAKLKIEDYKLVIGLILHQFPICK